MPSRRSPRSFVPSTTLITNDSWLAKLAESSPIAGVPGPGRWLIARFQPAALFSLKSSAATSSVAKTLLVPTSYAIKMALLDAAFRSGVGDEECAALVRALVRTEVRVAPPGRAVVTHTFVKIRQEPKEPNPLRPYGAGIAYREFVHHEGEWRWALDLGYTDTPTAERLAFLLPRVNYVGKRGSFIQFVGYCRAADLDERYVHPMPESGVPAGGWQLPRRWHAAILDDFGPEATLEALSSFSPQRIRRDRDRKFVRVLVPLGLKSAGPGYSEYET